MRRNRSAHGVGGGLEQPVRKPFPNPSAGSGCGFLNPDHESGPPSENMNTPFMPFARRSVSIAWTGLWAIGPATLNDVFTATSTPIRRHSLWGKPSSQIKVTTSKCEQS
jgi:hypothetical protein